MLVVMTIDHFGGPIADVTRQTIGFVSGAEGFVFLSGFVSGIVYGQYARRDPQLMVRNVRKRASIIYLVHIAILSFVGLVFLANSIYAEYWVKVAPLFRGHPIQAMLLGAALLYQPRYLDILPMYVVFLLLIPFVIRQFEKGRAPIILSSSALLWLSVQFRLPTYALHGLISGTDINLGYFDIFAWQVLFVFGSWFGYRRAVNPASSAAADVTIIWLSLIATVLFFLARHEFVVIPDVNIAMATDRATLAGVRLLNFIVIAVLVGSLTKRYSRFFNVKWLAFLGQHSLQVFSYHVVVLYLLMPVRWRIQELGGQAEILVCVAYVISLTIPAMMHRAYRRRTSVRNMLTQT